MQYVVRTAALIGVLASFCPALAIAQTVIGARRRRRRYRIDPDGRINLLGRREGVLGRKDSPIPRPKP